MSVMSLKRYLGYKICKRIRVKLLNIFTHSVKINIQSTVILYLDNSKSLIYFWEIPKEEKKTPNFCRF